MLMNERVNRTISSYSGNEKRFAFSERGNNKTLGTNLTDLRTQDRGQNVWVMSEHGVNSLNRFKMAEIFNI